MSVVASEARADAAAEALRQTRLSRTRAGLLTAGCARPSPLDAFERGLAQLKDHRPARGRFEGLRRGDPAIVAACCSTPGVVAWAGVPLSVPDVQLLVLSLKREVAPRLYCGVGGSGSDAPFAGVT